MLSTAEKKLYALVLGACAVSVLLGVAVGYMFFARPMMHAVTPARMTAAVPDLAAGEPAADADAAVFGTAEYTQYEETPPAAVSASEAHRYVVRIVDGYIAVFYAEHAGGTLKEVTTVSTAALPAADIDALREGIAVYTEEALSLILQDYGS